MRLRGTRRRKWLGFILIAAVAAAAAAAITYAATPSSQPEVSADVLPVLASVHVTASYVDCSKINSVAYFDDNPCQTFLLLASDHFGSATKVLAAETGRLTASGRSHSARQPADYNGGAVRLAGRSESWIAPNHAACAFVATFVEG